MLKKVLVLVWDYIQTLIKAPLILVTIKHKTSGFLRDRNPWAQWKYRQPWLLRWEASRTASIIDRPVLLLERLCSTCSVKVCGGLLYSKTRASRGRPEKDICCDTCLWPELAQHIIQICERTRGPRIKGHDDIMKFVETASARAGFATLIEPRINGGCLGLRKPDLVMHKDNHAFVVECNNYIWPSERQSCSQSVGRILRLARNTRMGQLVLPLLVFLASHWIRGVLCHRTVPIFWSMKWRCCIGHFC